MDATSKINNDTELQTALARASEIFDAQFDTAEGAELDALTQMIEQYESATISTRVTDVIAFVNETINLLGVGEDELSPIFGNRATASAILSGDRKISPEQAQALHELLHIPMDVLLKIVDNVAATDSRFQGDIKASEDKVTAR